MNRYRSIVLLLLCAVLVTVVACGSEEDTTPRPPLAEKSVYDFVLKDIDGNDVKMEQYQGKVLMVVNVASECGYTPQYAGLQNVYAKYKDQGFYVLGFPANNFGAQEPGSNEEIKTFCNAKYKVTFPMFSKISVKGADKHPFYRFLTEKTTDPEFSGEIKWNFNKFLIDKNGKVIARFDSGTEPESSDITSNIEKALKS
ncbi:MAG: glutathione peroxidase [Blastocatellia bacterium]|nr:glutathione peroxidase [Blastocatellia bacterium]